MWVSILVKKGEEIVKIIGSITKQMYYDQCVKFLSHTDLVIYEIPLKALIALDIGRLIYLDENTGEVVLESYRKKGLRQTKAFLTDKEENKPIINDTTNGPH